MYINEKCHKISPIQIKKNKAINFMIRFYALHMRNAKTPKVPLYQCVTKDQLLIEVSFKS